MPTPAQNHPKFFPALRLKNGVKNAEKEELESDVKACERLVIFGGGVLLFGLGAEIALGFIHPPHDSLFGRWGSVFATVIVFVGVGAEVWFSGMGSRRQGELVRRSNDELAKAQTELVKLRKQVAPRVIDQKAFLEQLRKSNSKPSKVFILYASAEIAPDAWVAAALLEFTIRAAGWPVEARQEVTFGSPHLQPVGMGRGFNPGIVIEFCQTDATDIDPFDTSKPYGALSKALAETIGSPSGRGDHELKPGELRIVVLPR